MTTFQTEQEILAALSDRGSSFGRADAINALVNHIGYASFDAEDLVDEWIEDLEWQAEHKGQEREWEWGQ
jgi:hypothetical protein